MITYKKGNLLDAAVRGEVLAIAHCCNCFVNMGSGIAPQIKRLFPYAWEADQQTEKGSYKKLGTFSLGDPDGFGGPLVYNLYGQHGYGKRKYGGRDLDYNALYDALAAMADDLQGYDKGDFERFPVGLPKLGAGLAGGDWDIIALMIEKTLVAAGCDVTVYVLE